jgi:hypothetical protein
MAKALVSKRFALAFLVAAGTLVIMMFFDFMGARARYEAVRKLESSTKPEVIAAADATTNKFLMLMISAGLAHVAVAFWVTTKRRSRKELVSPIHLPISTPK